MNEPPEETGRNQEESGEGAAARAKPTWLWVPEPGQGWRGRWAKTPDARAVEASGRRRVCSPQFFILTEAFN